MFLYNIRKKYLKNFSIEDGKEKQRKFKKGSLSVIIGFFVGMLFLSFFGYNPFSLIFYSFKNILDSKEIFKNFIVSFSILGLSGLAAIVSFKVGVFNIGISGQMIMGGSTSIVVAILIGDKMPKGLGQIFIILLSSAIGAIFAGIAVILKIYLKISEIVSTILLNWIAFFYAKWLFNPTHTNLLTSTKIESKSVGDNFALRDHGDPTIILFIIFLILIFISFVWLYKTKSGYSIKLVGLNQSAAKYSGINVSKKMITSMFISGALAGLLGAFIYFGQGQSYPASRVDVIPTIGFNGIAVMLVSFSNPIAMLPVVLLFTSLSTGIVMLQADFPEITPHFISFVMGIIMYFAAGSSIFLRIKPFQYIRMKLYGNKWKGTFIKYKEDIEKIDQKYFEKYDTMSKYWKIKWKSYWKIRIPCIAILKKEKIIEIYNIKVKIINDHLQKRNRTRKIYIKNIKDLKGEK